MDKKDEDFLMNNELNDRIREGDLFYINNVFLPDNDPRRIVGPLNLDEFEGTKREYYRILSNFSEQDKEDFPFIYWKLSLLKES